MNEKRAVNEFFAPEAKWQQQADLIAHLSQFSQKILLIAAPKGSGKTTFLRYFLQKAIPGLRKHLIQARADLEVEPLMKAIAQGFELDWDEAEEEIPSQAAFNRAPERKDTWVLLVDDAHLLKENALESLFQLINFQVEPRRQLHLVLAGESTLAAHLFGPHFPSEWQEKISLIELAGSPEEGKMHVSSKRKWNTRPITLGLLVGSVIAGSYLFFNGHSVDEESIQVPLNAAQLSQEKWEKPALTPQKSSVTFHFDKEEKPEKEILEDKAAPVSANATVPLTTDLPLLEPTGQEVITSSVAEKKVVSTVVPIEPAALTKREPSSKSTDKKLVATKPVLFSPEEKHLLSLDKNHYTLQLVGARKEAGVKAFLTQHAVENSAYCFHTKLAGKDWYVAVYGEYPSLEEAKKAVENMPAALKANPPWIRDIEGVQRDIRQSRTG